MNLDLYRRVLAGETLTIVLNPRALWRLTGPDHERYLNGQVTCDVTKLTEGHVAYGAVCTAKGKMEGDLHIAAHGSEYYLDSDILLRESLGARLEKFLIADDAAFEDVSDSWHLSHVFSTEKPAIPETSFIVKNDRFGLPGYDIWLASTGAVVIGDSLPSDIVETIRLEHAIPRWGAELTTNTLPPEAGPHMLNAISYTKGCYVGQETIARLKSVGHVNRTLVLLQSDSANVPPPETKLRQGDKDAGSITSAGFSPRLEKGIALAYVPYQLAAEGTVFETEGFKLTVTAPLNS